MSADHAPATEADETETVHGAAPSDDRQRDHDRQGNGGSDDGGDSVQEDSIIRERPAAAGDYELTRQIGHLLRRAHQRATAIFLSRMSEASLTPTQFATLVMLHMRGPVSQNLLGRLVAMDQATIQGVVSRLHERALIHRTQDEQDRRRMVLALTAEGEALLSGLYGIAAEITEETLAPLDTAERTVLLSALTKIS